MFRSVLKPNEVCQVSWGGHHARILVLGVYRIFSLSDLLQPEFCRYPVIVVWRIGGHLKLVSHQKRPSAFDTHTQAPRKDLRTGQRMWRGQCLSWSHACVLVPKQMGCSCQRGYIWNKTPWLLFQGGRGPDGTVVV